MITEDHMKHIIYRVYPCWNTLLGGNIRAVGITGEQRYSRSAQTHNYYCSMSALQPNSDVLEVKIHL